jgi:hypothetical protein
MLARRRRSGSRGRVHSSPGIWKIRYSKREPAGIQDSRPQREAFRPVR